jgi:ActR/RegA family two-component response regulator
MNAPLSAGRLRVLVVAGDPAVLELCRTVFGDTGDELVLFSSLASGVQDAQAMPPDLAFVDVALEQRAALALVHHIKAISQEAEVYAVTSMDALDAASQAVSLGATGVIMSPPSGDELLSAANGVKTRRAALRLRTQLRMENDGYRRALGYVARMASLADRPDGDNVGLAVVELFREASGMPRVALYQPTLEGADELRLSVSVGALAGAPAFCDEMGLMRYAKEAALEVIPLLAGRLSMGHVLAGGASWQEGPMRQAMHVLAAQATTSLMLGRGAGASGPGDDQGRCHQRVHLRVLRRHRGAGDRQGEAPRAEVCTGDDHHRQRSLPGGGRRRGPWMWPTRCCRWCETATCWARVDEHEFYLLLPETGGFGAQSCRRRVLALESSGKLQGVSMGGSHLPS